MTFIWLLGFSYIFLAWLRYHLFLHYGWFHQNLEKDFISTNMHTTLTAISMGELGI